MEARAMSYLLYFYKKTNNEVKFKALKDECFVLLVKHKDIIFELDNYNIFVFILSDYFNVWQMYEIGT
ncbi:hypothetical protein RCZ15_01710 [Capnocytophaga catalasegens]|uniref:Uncharacterized protein n=1 Tax=Capnocytophaga catalasegens TaxID=1004260 RepID=A0AAV5AV18_9FLAO|nr:hypothetical protein RCZ03_18290 [Capnocytophaga catalasegens]GJM49195.1 hypothetical protein RCZ15_01710 [Capnocytophaga catalasegens]GJM53161.1 hypothetical protein RCZ16_14780 [Capnocytophaga catalasegens]